MDSKEKDQLNMINSVILLVMAVLATGAALSPSNVGAGIAIAFAIAALIAMFFLSHSSQTQLALRSLVIVMSVLVLVVSFYKLSKKPDAPKPQQLRPAAVKLPK